MYKDKDINEVSCLKGIRNTLCCYETSLAIGLVVFTCDRKSVLNAGNSVYSIYKYARKKKVRASSTVRLKVVAPQLSYPCQ